MSKLLRISPDLSLPLDIVTSTLVVYGTKGMGKRLALDTPLATPTGWTTMGAVAVGDFLFNELGLPCRVTYVSPVAIGDSYRVTFSDGASVVADGEHLWFTESFGERAKARAGNVRTTLEILATLTVNMGTLVRAEPCCQERPTTRTADAARSRSRSLRAWVMAW